jgi:hypothetical protein
MNSFEVLPSTHECSFLQVSVVLRSVQSTNHVQTMMCVGARCFA